MGFAVAKMALEQGARVAIASSSERKVQDAVDRLNKLLPPAATEGAEGQRVVVKGHVVDLAAADPEARIAKLLADAVAANGGAAFDHIVSTAGRPDFRPLAQADLPYLARAAQLTVFVPLLLAKLAPAHLKPGHASSLTLTSGQIAERPIAGMSAMACFAAGAHGLVRNLAVDLAPLRVNVVSPGATETELWGDHAESLRKHNADKQLTGQVASADEVAEAFIYLMRNTNATGSVVSSSGGAVLK